MALSQRTYELIIVMPNLDKHDVFFEARELKILHPETPIVVLTPFSKEISKRVENEDLSFIDYIFSWLGEAELANCRLSSSLRTSGMPYPTHLV